MDSRSAPITITFFPGARVGGADLVGDLAGGGRERLVTGDRAADHQIQLVRRHAGVVQGLLSSLGGDVTAELVVGADPALADPGALHDPLVAGVNQLGEIVVGHAPIGHVLAQTSNTDPHFLARLRLHETPPAPCLLCAC